MNRETKFRVWCKNNKEWEKDLVFINSEGKLFQYTHKGMIGLRKDTHFISFSTGLKDKNDKDIYEGDIVKYTFDLPESLYATENGLKIRIHQVFWSDWRSSFSVGNKRANTDLFRYVRNGNRVEVIGNIYEDKHLLGE